jgi:hypothetical protein
MQFALVVVVLKCLFVEHSQGILGVKECKVCGFVSHFVDRFSIWESCKQPPVIPFLDRGLSNFSGTLGASV